MDQKRNLAFGVLLFVLWFGWLTYGPVLFPALFREVPVQKQVDKPDDAATDSSSDLVAKNGTEQPNAQKPEANPKELPKHPTRTLVLGSMDQSSGYGLEVELSSIGASVKTATLNDPRYAITEKVDPRPQLKVIGNHLTADKPLADLDPTRLPLTLDMTIPELDFEFEKLDRRAKSTTLNWEVIEVSPDVENKDITSAVTFQLESPDKTWAITKQFTLNRLPRDLVIDRANWDASTRPYDLNVKFNFHNKGKQLQKIDYRLQGPVGMALENQNITSKFRDIKAGFLAKDGTLTTQTLTAAELIKNIDKNKVEEWAKPCRYIGVDTQYFAALLVPNESQIDNPYFTTAKAMAVTRGEKNEHSDISLTLASQPLEVKAEKSIAQELTLYLGPKRQELLAGHGAEAVFDYGWFGSISHYMVRLLQTFHGWSIPYGIAIMMLTAIVRAGMFPLSKKQAVSGKKMKELQPLLNEIREKYKDDKQKQGQAQMELYRKAEFNPFGGCLIAFIQLPIFISLYQALNNCVDLRMAPFLYIDNLAAPDALFRLPFTLPFLGDTFNLLPLVTMCLYFIQQKTMMPPPTNEEMAMQQKVMNYMLIFMGFMFYNVPSGLCVYFIASTVWGMSERKLIDYLPQPVVDLKKKVDDAPAKEGFFAKLLRQAQEAADLQQQLKNEDRRGKK